MNIDGSVILKIVHKNNNINQSINQSWVYIAHKRKASYALVR